jgi:hypothetical protein
MASLEKKGDGWYCPFYYQGKRHTLTLGKVDEEAETKAHHVDYLLMRLRQGFLQVPTGIDIVTFMQPDGKPPEPDKETPEVLTLGSLRDQYLQTRRNGSLEPSTLEGIELHFKHLVKTLGERFPIQELGLANLQRHVDRRAKMKGVRGRLSPATIKKEVVTLRTAWNWGVNMNLLAGRLRPDLSVSLPVRSARWEY